MWFILIQLLDMPAAETLKRPQTAEAQSFRIDRFPIQPSSKTVEVVTTQKSLPPIEEGTRSAIYKVNSDTEFNLKSGGWSFYKIEGPNKFSDYYVPDPGYELQKEQEIPDLYAQAGDYIIYAALPEHGDVNMDYRSAGLPLTIIDDTQAEIPSLLKFMLNDFREIKKSMSTGDAVIHHESKKRIPIYAYGNPLKHHAA